LESSMISAMIKTGYFAFFAFIFWYGFYFRPSARGEGAMNG
jgi:hypothetical protein